MKPIVSEVKSYKGRPAMYINGQPVPPQIYALTDSPMGNRSWEFGPSASIAAFAEIGFKLYQLDVWFDHMLDENGVLDLTFPRKQIRGVVRHCPDAAVMFRLHINPPFWWLRSNPDEWTGFADTPTKPTPDYIPAFEKYLHFDLQDHGRASYASKKWQDYMSGQLKRFLLEFSLCPEADHLMGIQLANGVFGENHYWGFMHHDPDTSEPMRLYFTKWLREKYATPAALQQAWNDPAADFDSVTVPGMERHKVTEGIFRNPQKERRFSDYYEAQHTCVTEVINHFSALVKQHWPRPIITGIFYGYYLSLFGRQAAGGHLKEQDILNSPYIDFMSAPVAYSSNNRSPGGPGLARGLIESVTAHGKVWLDEMDHPTHYGSPDPGMKTYDQPTSLQNNRKFVLSPFVRGGGMWYYDFGEFFSTGWWEDPYYRTDVAKIKAIYDKYFHTDAKQPADVLLVMDTKVFFQTGTSKKDDPITDVVCVNNMALSCYQTGAAVAMCYLSDIGLMELDNFKAVVFVNCFYLTKKERDFIRDKVAKNGRNLIWIGFPGYTDGNTCSTDFVSQATNIKMTAAKKALLPEVTLSKPFTNAAAGGKGVVESKLYLQSNIDSAPQIMQNFFSPADDGAEIIGKYSDGTAAACRKQSPAATDWFFGVPLTDATQLHELFAACGCHIYNASSDSTLAGMGIIMIQTESGGERTVCLKNGKQVKMTLTPAQTVVLDAETGEILI